MFHQARDAYSLSLGGMTTIASFVVAPAVATDRINTANDARVKQSREQLGPASRREQPPMHLTPESCCA